MDNNTILLAKIRDVLSALFGTFTSDLAIIKAKLEGISDLIIRNDITTDTDTIEFNSDLTDRLCKCTISFDLLKTGSGSPSPENPVLLSGYDSMSVAILESHEPEVYLIKEIDFTDTVYSGDYDIISGSGNNTKNLILLSSLSWTSQLSDNKTIFYATVNDKENTIDNIIECEIFKAASRNGTSVNNAAAAMPDNNMICASKSTISPRLYIRADGLSDADFETLISGKKVAYQLATPADISATPEAITPIEGDNVISTNSLHTSEDINTTGIEVCYFETVNNYFKNKEV